MKRDGNKDIHREKEWQTISAAKILADQAGTYCRAFSQAVLKKNNFSNLFYLQFLVRSLFPLHFLAIFSRAACRPVASCATL